MYYVLWIILYTVCPSNYIHEYVYVYVIYLYKYEKCIVSLNNLVRYVVSIRKNCWNQSLECLYCVRKS